MGSAVPALSAADVLASVPGLSGVGAEITVHDFRRLPGASLSIEDVLDLAGSVAREVAAGAAGAVVIQGTDTIEETAFLLDLVHSSDAPVVVTGAMRHASLAGADGPANILAALVAAASPRLRGIGCVVVFGDEIHAARFVHKAHANQCHRVRVTLGGSARPGRRGRGAATHPAGGPVACGPAGRARPPGSLRPGRPADHVLGGRRGVAAGRGGTGSWHGGCGLGVGHVPAWLVPDLEALARQIPVVLASRTGAGPVLREMYGFPGSEQDLQARGLIGAGFLDPPKARLLLHLLLARGARREEIIEAFRAARDASG